MTRRGSLVTVALQGDDGKPRPALVLQSDLLAGHASVVLCLLTTSPAEADFRVRVEPSAANGLQEVSQVMVDKLVTVRRDKVGEPFGALEPQAMRAVERALLLVVGMS